MPCVDMAASMMEEGARTMTMDELLFKLAATIPIGKATSSPSNPSMATPPSSPTTSFYNDFGTSRFQQLPVCTNLPPAPENLPKPSKPINRKRPRPFEIFVDPDARVPPPKKPDAPRNDGRTPLGTRSGGGNTAPSPPPRSPDTPFNHQASDPFWFNRENHPPFTPPSTPTASPSSTPRQARHQRTAPRNMELYDLLELCSWKASNEEIRQAYRMVALKHHPDKVRDEEKEAANARMARINAAKEILLNGAARRKYNRDGKVPW